MCVCISVGLICIFKEYVCNRVHTEKNMVTTWWDLSIWVQADPATMLLKKKKEEGVINI